MVTVGIDEVGRGCWAGPLVAGAVILSQQVPGLTDSKLLSKKQREKCTAQITLTADAIGLGWVSANELDQIGLTASVRLAMQRALEQININYDSIIIDGNFNFLANNPLAEAEIKADSTIPSVSAASVMAKVARDNFMAEASLDYPDYGFESHVGYGTALHLEKLKLHGVCDLHRRSFKPIKRFISV